MEFRRVCEGCLEIIDDLDVAEVLEKPVLWFAGKVPFSFKFAVMVATWLVQSDACPHGFRAGAKVRLAYIQHPAKQRFLLVRHFDAGTDPGGGGV